LIIAFRGIQTSLTKKLSMDVSVSPLHSLSLLRSNSLRSYSSSIKMVFSRLPAKKLVGELHWLLEYLASYNSYLVCSFFWQYRMNSKTSWVYSLDSNWVASVGWFEISSIFKFFCFWKVRSGNILMTFLILKLSSVSCFLYAVDSENKVLEAVFKGVRSVSFSGPLESSWVS